MRKTSTLLIIMTIILLTGLSPITKGQAFAADTKAEQIINALGIMDTDQGSYSGKAGNVTRSGFAQMLVNMSSMKGKVSGECNVSLFHDVSKKYWAAGYIQTAITEGWMSGYLNGSFQPDKGITLQEAVNGMVRLLGYTNADFSGNLIGGQMALYYSKDLDKNISKSKTAFLSVSDCINLFYNTLNTTTKDGRVYAETLGYSLDAEGKLDYISLVNVGTHGPIIADDNWKTEIPFSVYQADYYKNDAACSYSDIDDYDVLYYSESLNTIWAYDNKITGRIQSINPNQLSPETVTVAGKEYELETSEMTIEFSNLGNIDEGSIVTLLLGKDNTVAGALSMDEYNTTITGVVIETGTHLTEQETGGYTYSHYAVFVDAAGNEYQQDYDVDKISFAEGELLRVIFKDGKATVNKFELADKIIVNAAFSSDGNTLGNIPLASNVKILDLKENQYINLYPERLAGVNLSSLTVYYYELNDKREISQLILNNVTGDMDQYGIFTGMDIPMNSDRVTYKYLIDGVSGSIATNSFEDFNTDIGPQHFEFEGNTLTASHALTGILVSSIGKTTVQDMDTKYPFADDYDVYYRINGEYIATTIDKISDLTKYKVTAYYDKSISLGGRIRIIVAESIN